MYEKERREGEKERRREGEKEERSSGDGVEEGGPRDSTVSLLLAVQRDSELARNSTSSSHGGHRSIYYV